MEAQERVWNAAQLTPQLSSMQSVGLISGLSLLLYHYLPLFAGRTFLYL